MPTLVPGRVVVAGHICLDIIPAFTGGSRDLSKILVPGKLVNVGEAEMTPGGVLGNTGLALSRLGADTGLLGRVGDDPFGRVLLELLRKQSPDLVRNLASGEGEATSYTVVISPPGVDRVFLHCPGTNDSLGPEDFELSSMDQGPKSKDQGPRLLHFGYPPIMRRFWSEGGSPLRELFQKAKEGGWTTSLDMVKPDPQSESGRQDWKAWMKEALPSVDLFLPSLEEVLLMLDPRKYSWAASNLDPSRVDGKLLAEVSSELLSYGCAVVVLKLGEFGLYLRSSDQGERLVSARLCHPGNVQTWQGRELYSTCYQVPVRGTRAAGDSTNAGILAGLARGLDPRYIVRMAAAVGACSVETSEGPGRLPPWEEIEARVTKGWKQHPLALQLAQFKRNEGLGIWNGPRDRDS